MGKVRTIKRGKTYTYLFEAGKKPNGKRNTITKGGFASATEAYEAGIKAYTNWKHGNIGITSEKLTVAEYMETWLSGVTKGLAANSIKSYTYNIKHISRLLGNIMLTELRPRHVDGFYKKLADEGYARAYIKSIKSVLHQALAEAVYPAELIPFNPSNDINIPKSAPEKVIKRTITRPETFETIMQKYPFGHTMHIVFVISYHTGMRISEICGLTWDDIDFDKRTLSVTHQIIYEPKIGNFYTPKLKTDSSYRTIYMDSMLFDELTIWRNLQENNARECGKGYIRSYYDDTGKLWHFSGSVTTDKMPVHFICTNKKGMPVTSGKASPYFAKFGTNSHSFRHSHATLLSEQKVPPKEIALRLGHKKIDTTMNSYTDETEIMLQNTKDSFEKIMSQTDG